MACRTESHARERCTFITEQLNRLRLAGREDFADKLLELAAKAATKELDRIVRGVDAIVAGNFETPAQPASPLMSSPTFKEFAERWTSGELHTAYPDHVKCKDSADDLYRLTAHVFPLIGDVPLLDFRFEHADLVMRSLPPELSSGSRRHVAQLITRILKLAVYPGRIIEQSPIPKGFLPKPQGARAQAWLYPDEEARLLAATSIPLLHRVLYGVLTREGMRTSEAAHLVWADVDLDSGTITLDENKSDDPRAWVLDEGVTRALVRWKTMAVVEPKRTDLVFSSEGRTVDVEHLANTFRTHLASVESIRPVLFERKKNRTPIRAHDLRATFVTLALGTGRTETWVADRTGHKSSAMINRYRRAARTAMELNLGWLRPLDEALPELSAGTAKAEPSTTPTAQSTGSPGRSAPMASVPTTLVEADSALSATRQRLVGALTAAVQDSMLQGDHEAAEIAISALRQLMALEASSPARAGSLPDHASEGILPFDRYRSGRG